MRPYLARPPLDVDEGPGDVAVAVDGREQIPALELPAAAVAGPFFDRCK